MTSSNGKDPSATPEDRNGMKKAGSGRPTKTIARTGVEDVVDPKALYHPSVVRFKCVGAMHYSKSYGFSDVSSGSSSSGESRDETKLENDNADETSTDTDSRFQHTKCVGVQGISGTTKLPPMPAHAALHTFAMHMNTQLPDDVKNATSGFGGGMNSNTNTDEKNNESKKNGTKKAEKNIKTISMPIMLDERMDDLKDTLDEHTSNSKMRNRRALKGKDNENNEYENSNMSANAILYGVSHVDVLVLKPLPMEQRKIMGMSGPASGMGMMGGGSGAGGGMGVTIGTRNGNGNGNDKGNGRVGDQRRQREDLDDNKESEPTNRASSRSRIRMEKPKPGDGNGPELEYGKSIKYAMCPQNDFGISKRSVQTMEYDYTLSSSRSGDAYSRSFGQKNNKIGDDNNDPQMGEDRAKSTPEPKPMKKELNASSTTTRLGFLEIHMGSFEEVLHVEEDEDGNTNVDVDEIRKRIEGEASRNGQNVSVDVEKKKNSEGGKERDTLAGRMNALSSNRSPSSVTSIIPTMKDLKQFLDRFDEASAKIQSHMHANALFVQRELQNDFINRTYAAGGRVVSAGERNLERMKKLLGDGYDFFTGGGSF